MVLFPALFLVLPCVCCYRQQLVGWSHKVDMCCSSVQLIRNILPPSSCVPGLVIGRNFSSHSCCCKAFLNNVLGRFEGRILSDQLLFWHCFHKPAHWAWRISPPSVFRDVLQFQSMLLVMKYCQVFKVVSNWLSPSFASEGPNCLQTLEPAFFWVSLNPQLGFVIGFVSFATSPALDWGRNTASAAFLRALSVFFSFPKCNASCGAENEWEENEWKCFESWGFSLSFVQCFWFEACLF